MSIGLSSPLRYYGQLLKERLHLRPPAGRADGLSELTNYPSNHKYRVGKGGILPSFQLYTRMRKITPLYGDDMDSLLDIGCCRGAYVLSAARRPACRRAVGVDVAEPFIQTAEAVRTRLGIQTVRFLPIPLEECVARVAELGGPFHTVLMLGMYHYLFWGGSKQKTGYLDHGKILSLVDSLCSHQVIFAARLEVSACPTFIRKRAAGMGESVVYTTESFLAAARQRFDVTEAGKMEKGRLLLVLRSRRGKSAPARGPVAGT